MCHLVVEIGLLLSLLLLKTREQILEGSLFTRDLLLLGHIGTMVKLWYEMRRVDQVGTLEVSRGVLIVHVSHLRHSILELRIHKVLLASILCYK